ncbi:hypothetical protein TRFO_27969 [Tritrichomonas foetus]|uniref:BTB domain-containing protein n=1 Tax=Tritrichomonas foetus TaxID=1144522 RepID=A0A1J4K4U9_9EUKA|nr:hypothetical protein TRFO_27969 [Tritrichomonas foetus]|eukprot:OHT04525.1 hypothetical protein TRFO_27969 [Tritrichomonas foetus]
MEKEYHINTRIIPKALEYLNNKQFIDCILTDGQYKYNAHKIILSQQSQWFFNYFDRHPTLDAIQEVPIPFNPNDIMKNLIEFLYSQPLRLTIDNAVTYLKASEVYGIAKLKMVITSYLSDVVHNQNLILKITKQFTEYGLIDSAIEYVGELATILCESPKHKRRIVYDSICPEILAAILKNKKFNKYSETGKIEIIDEFVGDKQLTENEKQSLETVIDWSKEKSYLHFVRNSCNWVTAATSRPLIKKILDIRRKDINIFEEEMKNPTSSMISRWYPFVWAECIANATECTKSPTIDVVSYANRLGKITSKSYSPVKYGLLQANATPQFAQLFGVENALHDSDSNYYLSQDMSFDANYHKPFYSLLFSPSSHFFPTKITIRSDIPRKLDTKRQYPKAIILEGNTGAGQLTDPICDNVEFKDGIADQQLKLNVPVASLKITLKGEEANGGSMLRIRYIDVKGYFMP